MRVAVQAAALARRTRARLLLWTLRRLSKCSVPDLIDATSDLLKTPPDVLLRNRESFTENDVVDLATRYRIALEHDPVVRDLFTRLYALQKELGQSILQGRYEGGRDVTANYRTAFGVVEDLLALPALLLQRKAEIEELTYGLPPEQVDKGERTPTF